MGKRKQDLAALITSWRISRGYSHGQAARLVRVDRTSWLRWEQGQLMGVDDLKRIARATGIDAAVLLESVPT